MAQLIDSLLDLARVTRSDMRQDAVDLSQLARATAERLRSAEPERQVELLVAETLPCVGDGRLLGIAFDNLLGNAWKFTRARGSARIEIGGERENGLTTFFVRDNGAGFDMQYAGKLFGAFQRFHSHEQFEGTGVGLSIVQRIIHRHGGRIWAEAEVDKGATFYLTLA
jgi:light-regulated signal transduction histidine kinase (bacteriophytochrome)